MAGLSPKDSPIVPRSSELVRNKVCVRYFSSSRYQVIVKHDERIQTEPREITETRTSAVIKTARTNEFEREKRSVLNTVNVSE